VAAGILERLPDDLQVLRVGHSPGEVACTVTATPVVVAVMVATVATAVGNCAPGWNNSEWVINPAAELAELAPTLGVRQLIALRERQLTLAL
jgi:hypothetical protein